MARGSGNGGAARPLRCRTAGQNMHICWRFLRHFVRDIEGFPADNRVLPGWLQPAPDGMEISAVKADSLTHRHPMSSAQTMSGRTQGSACRAAHVENWQDPRHTYAMGGRPRSMLTKMHDSPTHFHRFRQLLMVQRKSTLLLPARFPGVSLLSIPVSSLSLGKGPCGSDHVSLSSGWGSSPPGPRNSVQFSEG